MKKVLLGIALCICAGVAQAAVYQFGLNSTNNTGGFLSGLFEAPPNSSSATAGEVGPGISYDTGTRMMDFNLAYGLFGFQPLQGGYLASHLHIGAPGVPGPVSISLEPIRIGVGTNAGFFSGAFPLTQPQEDALLATNMYVNIHSTVFPDGEIRAQLVPAGVPEPAVWALAGLGIAALIVFRRRD